MKQPSRKKTTRTKSKTAPDVNVQNKALEKITKGLKAKNAGNESPPDKPDME
jgi:hypothetical protein